MLPHLSIEVPVHTVPLGIIWRGIRLCGLRLNRQPHYAAIEKGEKLSELR